MFNKIWIEIYFEPVTVDSVEIFHHFEFWHHGNRPASLLIVPKKYIFWGASSKLIKIWQLSFPQSYKVFMKPSYTIVPP